MNRVGILGGTFNPPHVGHLLCAQEALTQLGLDRVVLMPVYEPPHKDIPNDPGPDVRLKLCVLATEDDPRLDVSDIEIAREGTSYTVDTLRELRETAPDDDLTVILGADVAKGLQSWREPEEVLSLARIAVTERAGEGHSDVIEGLGSLADSGEIDFFEMPRVDVSSSSIRERLSHDEPVRYLLTDPVREEIERRGWYT
jgi:nicotinate-nucleotide adenylyltransferase